MNEEKITKRELTELVRKNFGFTQLENCTKEANTTRIVCQNPFLKTKTFIDIGKSKITLSTEKPLMSEEDYKMWLKSKTV